MNVRATHDREEVEIDGEVGTVLNRCSRSVMSSVQWRLMEDVDFIGLFFLFENIDLRNSSLNGTT